MVHDPALLDALERFDTERWTGRVYRHMLGSAAPELANERGARWNPPGTSALYTSLAETTAKAEGDHVIAMQPVPPRATRTIYELDVAIKNLLDLTDAGRLTAIGITEEDFESIPWEPCQRVGGAVAWLGHDGLLIPSVRDSDGSNLVIFTANQPPESEIVVQGSHVIEKR
jgi:RES domain-containing protein